MTQEKFDTIYQRAAHRKGGAAELEKIVRAPLSQAELSQITDDRWLAAFTEKVFQCGISWNVVRKKWPQFEEVFFEFDIEKMLMLPNEMWEQKAQDPRIIRHLTKVMTIPANAMMIHNAKREADSFSQMVADWPSERITELWDYLKNTASD